jgi:lactoylglutathione lyase
MALPPFKSANRSGIDSAMYFHPERCDESPAKGSIRIHPRQIASESDWKEAKVQLMSRCCWPPELGVKYLHTMVRVTDLQTSLRFYCDALGLREVRRTENEKGRFTLVFLSAPGDEQAQIELTYNWDPEDYGIGRAFGHLAYQVDDIYAACERLQKYGVTINRPPRDGRMAFVRSPDKISVELLQKGNALAPQEPWVSMPNTGQW